MPHPHNAERLEQLWNPLARIEMSEAAEERSALDLGRCDAVDGPGRVGNHPHRSVVAALAHALFHVARVHDQARRLREDLADERKLVRPRLPDRCHAAVEHAVGEQATGNACVSLHRGEVAGAVLVTDGQAGDEVVQDEVVQDDDTGTPAQRFDDPAVRLGIVADVVEGDVSRDGSRLAPTDDLDLDEPRQRRQ
jgi:hypothetical protein